MKYPAILRNILGNQTVLAVNAKLFIHMSGEFELEDSESYSFDSHYTDITHEYLSNTWGVVETKEHAEFIIELAKLHGFGVWNSHKIDCGESIEMFFFCPVDNELQLYHNDISSSMIKGEKQITIPLPPKTKEWPQVGDEVESISTGNIYKAIAIGKSQVCVEYHNKTLRVLNLDAIKKPKSKQELLIEELQTKLCNNNAVDNYILACDIINGEIEGLSYESNLDLA